MDASMTWKNIRGLEARQDVTVSDPEQTAEEGRSRQNRYGTGGPFFRSVDEIL